MMSVSVAKDGDAINEDAEEVTSSTSDNNDDHATYDHTTYDP